LGGRLDVDSLADVDAVLVCGGLTPGYADALVPSAADLRAWLGRRAIPYAGFSAGSAIAADSAVVGGWLCDGVQVCPEDSAEDLDEVKVRAGLGLVPFTVDVHAAQWGTLPRLIAAVDVGGVEHGVAIDENTAAIVDGDEATVAGLGRVYSARADGQAMHLRSYRSGDRFSVAGGQGDD
jgi:cyanophycinase